jgi:hypothetical protein
MDSAPSTAGEDWVSWMSERYALVTRRAHRVGDRAAGEHARNEHRSAGAHEAQAVLDVLDDALGSASTSTMS